MGNQRYLNLGQIQEERKEVMFEIIIGGIAICGTVILGKKAYKLIKKGNLKNRIVLSKAFKRLGGRK